jgi:hypothetical protein
MGDCSSLEVEKKDSLQPTKSGHVREQDRNRREMLEEFVDE